jgi:Tfp pilus assembly protein PilO
MFVQDLAKRLKTLGYGLHAAGLAAALAIAGAAYVVLLLPADRGLSACQDQAARLEATLADADKVRAEKQRLEDAVSAIEKRTAELHQRIPDEPLEAEFLGQVSEAATKVGLQLSDYRPGAIVVKDGYSQIEVHLKCQGSYPSLCAFLDRLAALPRLSHVVQMEVAASDNEVLPATITLAIFCNLKPKAAQEKNHG